MTGTPATAGGPQWTRPALGLRRVCEWAGRDWAAWNMGGDRWLLECDGRDVRMPLLDWRSVQRIVSTWATPPAGSVGVRRSIVTGPIEDVPW